MKNIKTIYLLLFFSIFFLEITTINADTVDIRDFGAIGDGVTNSTTAFESAIETLQNNDVLLITEGVYLIDQLTFKEIENLTITGGGTLAASTTGRRYFVVIRESPGIKINNIIIDGKSNTNLGIDVYDSPNGKFENVRIKNIKGKNTNWSAGIRLRQNNSDFKILNSKIENITSEIKAAIGIWISTMANEQPSHNVVVDGTEISYISSQNDADGIKIQQHGVNSSIQIKNNYFLNTRKRAVKVQADGVLIENNLVERTQDYSNGFAVFSVYGNNVKVFNNYFESFGNSSVNVFVDVAAVENTFIDGNTHINSVNSSTKIKDFLLTKYHPIDNSYTTRNLHVRGNTSVNIRSFVRVRSSLSNSALLDNTIVDLNSNFIFIVDEEGVNRVQLTDKINTIDHFNHSHNRVYRPNKPGLEVIINEI